MMGPTHAIGGAAALAGYTIITGNQDVPIFAFGLAAIAALVPDTDLDRSMIGQFPLIFAKLMTYPLWMNPGHTLTADRKHLQHRGRTHSFAALAGFVALLWFWLWALGWLATSLGHPMLGFTDHNLKSLLLVGAIGYLSHLGLDLLNVNPGVQLLWPLPFRFGFPPYKRLRFKSESLQAEWLIYMPCGAFFVWYLVQYKEAIIAATHNDPLPAAILGLLSGLLTWLVVVIHHFLTSSGSTH
jgi:membrane-bound metal-dependent hydrolase YbcI (DUF457 family)